MKPRFYDQLSLFEKVLYHECFNVEPTIAAPVPVPYSAIASVRHSGWICTVDDRILNHDFYHPAPLVHHLDIIEGKKPIESKPVKCDAREKKLLPCEPQKRIEADPSDLPTKRDAPVCHFSHTADDAAPFGGQDQEGLQLNKETPTASVFGEFWIETVYKTIKEKTYGPYLVKRWRDETGRKRSQYLGKAPTETEAPEPPV
jgi:hypothetical protein